MQQKPNAVTHTHTHTLSLTRLYVRVFIAILLALNLLLGRKCQTRNNFPSPREFAQRHVQTHLYANRVTVNCIQMQKSTAHKVHILVERSVKSVERDATQKQLSACVRVRAVCLTDLPSRRSEIRNVEIN